jgi:hypothetical protein
VNAFALVLAQVASQAHESSKTVSTTTDAAWDIVLQNGVMGAVFLIVVIPLALYCYHLGKALQAVNSQHAAEIKTVQDARTADAKAVVDKLLDLNDKWNRTMSDQLRVMESLEGAMKETKNSLQDVRDFMIEDHSGRRR